MDMTINNVALSSYGATLLSADYGYANITNYNNWLRGAKAPLFYGQDITYTTVKYTILVEGANLTETDKNCSDIYNAMTKAIVKVNGADWSIDGHTTAANDSNRISPLAREIEIDFEGIKVADRETLTKALTIGSAWTFDVKGNQEVPCRVEIIPDMGYQTFEFRLNGKTYPIRNVLTGSLSLVIDSEQGLVTLDGNNKIEDYESWELPVLKGGANTLSVNGAPTILIGYNGRWA